ncbi:MAG: hypothetical protein LUO89_03660, partial [Methanothrix sp.]|nr:hypothetical protein [Methanothrix sp.]
PGSAPNGPSSESRTRDETSLPGQVKWVRRPGASPHFSPGFSCGGGSGQFTCVALGRTPRRTVKYACGILLSRAL